MGVVFLLSILTLTSRNLIKQDLTIGNFLFLNPVALIICYGFAFRYSCKIYLNEKVFSINYYFKDGKQLLLPTQEIVSFDKHPDTVSRYYKKLFVNTIKTTFLIKYNISDNSDKDMLKLLSLIVEENKKRLTQISV